jgi:hypothetical protein
MDSFYTKRISWSLFILRGRGVGTGLLEKRRFFGGGFFLRRFFLEGHLRRADTAEEELGVAKGDVVSVFQGCFFRDSRETSAFAEDERAITGP